MKKIYYVFLMMAIALAACEKTDQPKEQPEEQPEEQQEPEKPQEPQVYPSSSITVLSARQGTSTPEDEVCTKLFDGNFYDKWCSVTNFAGTYENRVSGQGGFDYIIWKTESSIVLGGYMLTTGNDTAEFTEGDILCNTTSGERVKIATVNYLDGVYCVNKGYYVFTRIEKLRSNDEYTIVKKNTKDGLRLYDHIALNAADAVEGKIIY